MMKSTVYLILLFGYVSWSTCTNTEVNKRQVQQQYAGPTAGGQQQQQPPPEYLEFLQSLQSQQHQQDPSSQHVQQLVATPTQQPSRQYYQPTSPSAYSLHQSRLNAALNPSNYQQNTESDAVSAANDAALQRQAVLNAQQAAQSFRSSYQQRGPSSQVRYSTGSVKEAQPTYAAEAQQIYQQRPQVQQPKQSQQQAYLADQAQQTAAIQALYQQQYQQAPQNSPSLVSYQQQANIAEQAAIAFQQALQQQSKPGATAQRPRLLPPQYVLEQQHSYVVPNTKEEEASVPTEQYNLAALQQAYQQIENANQKQQASIYRQPQRLVPTPQRLVPTPQVAYEQDESGHNIGDGDGFESLKQASPSVKKQPVLPTAPPQRTQIIRQRVQPQPAQVIPQQQYILQQVQPQQVQPQQVVQQRVQPQQIVQQRVQPQQVVHQRVQPQQIVQQRVQPQQITQQRVQPQRVQPQTVTLEPSYKQTTISYQQPEIQTYEQPQAVLPTPIPEIPKRQRIQTNLQPVVPTVQIPRAKPQQYYTPEVKAPTVQAASPSLAPYSNGQLPNKVGNIDLNLLRSLYAAAESLAITQKDSIAPVSEDDLIKALLAQGRREQQAADIIQTAAKNAPAPPPEDKDVVRIPTPKNQRPITQEELQALVDAGYDVRPVGEPKPYDANENVDPIKQQYLRQAQFLEQQLALKNVRANQKRGTSQQSRRTRGNSSRKQPVTEESSE